MVQKSLCEVCKLKEFKYKCPACCRRTCSLQCVNSHKESSGCSGERDKTQDDSTLLSGTSWSCPHNYKGKQLPAFIPDNVNSIDEVISALIEAGLESSNLIFGIDFTKSDEWSGRYSFNRRSLHAVGGDPNPYEKAISIIGRTLSPFVEYNLIPCFGFGDVTTRDRNVFSFYPDHRSCHGFEEVLARYKEIVPYINLSGPTSFAPVINAAIDIVQQNMQYHVLVIIADGQVTRTPDIPPGQLSPQEQATVDSIVAASYVPLSIVLVGVGDGPWDAMKTFDDNIPQRAFDNFQFVNFTKIMSENEDMSKKEAAFALAALMEIPIQYGATQQLEFNDKQVSGGLDSNPLPPPQEVIEHDKSVRQASHMLSSCSVESSVPVESNSFLEQNLQLKYDLTNDKYLDFIGQLRLKVCDKDKLSHGRPILPLQADADPPCIDVHLQESGLDKGFVRIRRCDLRLINFQDPFGNSLNVDDFEIYDDDSRLLDFGIEGFGLGFFTFVQAVNYLVHFCKELSLSKTRVDMGTPSLVRLDGEILTAYERKFYVRRHLPVLSLVLCEATKLDLLSCILSDSFKFGLEVPLSSWWLERIHDWGLFSKELLTEEIHYDTADCDIYLPYEKNDWHDGRRLVGVTCQDVARFLGVLQAVSPPPEPMEDEYAECLLGKHQVEIYSVSVYLKGGRSGSVYGNIKVHNNYGAFSIYERDSNECESIESHGTLSLQDPNDLIIVENYVEVELDLLEGGNNSELSKGKALWDGYLDEMFDSRISGLVKGKNGYAIVYYTVFYKAIIAEVEATLVSKSRPHDSDDVCVCGRLCARYGGIAYVTDAHDRYYQTILFNKPVAVGKESSALPCTLEAGTCNLVKLHEAIKLSRSRVSVPTGQYLILKGDLKSCDGKPIVTGSMKWFAEGLGESEGIMDGHSDDSHSLQVKVNWIEPKQ